MKVFLSLLFFVSLALQANDCLELTKCIESVSLLTGKKYIYDAREVKGGLQATSNMAITAENADTLFTYILDMNGYARVPTAEKNTYMIIPARDIRYQSLPTITVDAANPPKIPDNYDYYMMAYNFKHHNQGQARAVANSLRPFMSRYARVIELKGAGSIIIQETASKLTKAFELIKSFDRELTKEELKAYLEEEKMRAEERKLERREGKKENHPKKQNEKADKTEEKN